ncbi:908_t:CDS:2 [Diversispora eburnea]|uniref:908_t:CDS:1 n=1 Tax=Diversispora eburnea TaxID=1213867 RepID=A0A9N8VYY8_9GLOM|nr:908_t:CDS:2 [Diversispora eburnea]
MKNLEGFSQVIGAIDRSHISIRAPSKIILIEKIYSDSGYANYDWLLVPYKDNGHLTQVQNHYNYIHSTTRIKIEQAFGLLKSHWRVLQNPIETNFKIVSHIVSCCYILHNICEEIIDEFDIISDQVLINNGTTSEVNIINDTERDLIADYIFSK